MGTGMTIVLLSVVVLLAYLLMTSMRSRHIRTQIERGRGPASNDSYMDECDPLFSDEVKTEQSVSETKSEQSLESDDLPFISTQDFNEVILTAHADDEKGHAAPKAQCEITPEYIILNVMARDNETFSGPHVLQALLSMGLRFGDMSVFHKYDTTYANNNKGDLLFSVASAVEPGIFDLDTMGSFQTPGLTLFLTIPGPSDPFAAYDAMIETADRLAERLSGEVMDLARQPLATETIEANRIRISQICRGLQSEADII